MRLKNRRRPDLQKLLDNSRLIPIVRRQRAMVSV